MANLYPPKLSPSVRRKSQAEVQVYSNLAKVLDNKYHVFHSVRWSNIYDRTRASDGECDFIIAHPVHGMLAIEVKGGVEITQDKNSDVWRSKDHKGKLHKIKNPVEQAMIAKHQIKKLLDKSKEWPKQNIHIAHGVIFPDVATPEERLGLEIPAELVCYSDQLRTGLDRWVEVLLRVGKKDRSIKPLGDNGIAALKKIFGDSIRLNSNIRIAIEEARTEFKELESRQLEILDNIREIPRALIKGGAGTGKTVLAMEEAKRSADKGLKTLYTCYNKPLEIDTSRKLANRKNLTIKTFHSLCRHLVEKFNHTMPSRKSDKEYFDDQLPEALFDIMSENSDSRYDAIIVDEGQDFKDHWWAAVLVSLTDEGKLRVFADNNQNVYGGVSPKLKENTEAIPVSLTQNFRNTKAIHRIASLHYEGEEIEAHGLDGMDVSWLKADSPQARIKKCIEKLKDLLDKDKVDNGDIAVLFNEPKTKNEFKKQIEEQKNGIRITDAENLTEDSVVVDTVKRFKGLDRMAIIWVVDGNARQSRELAYVGFSRARAYLCVISSKKDYKWLKGDITQNSRQPSIPFATNSLSPTPFSTPNSVPPSTRTPSPTPVSTPNTILSKPPAPSPAPVSTPIKVPAKNSTKKTVEKNWIAEAKHKATGCNTLEELKFAFQAFESSMLNESKGKNVVFEGAIGADFMVIGEYQDGVSPFEDRAGELLDKMLDSINRSRDKDTIVTYLNYWRPSNDRERDEDDLAICRPFVGQMITLLKPKLILIVGEDALKSIMRKSDLVPQLGTKRFNLKINDTDSFKVCSTFHPGYLIKHPQEKSKAWRDLLKVEEFLNSH